jgi:hypothetical protein
MNLFLIMSLSAAILGALVKVAAADRYHGKWLSDASTVAIINFEYNLSGESRVKAKDLNPKVSRHKVYKLSTESTGVEMIENNNILGCIFRWKHDNTHCYYFTASKDIVPPADKGSYSIHHPADVQRLFDHEGACLSTVTDEVKSTLADLMKPANKGGQKTVAVLTSSSTPDAQRELQPITAERITNISEVPRTPNTSSSRTYNETTSTAQDAHSPPMCYPLKSPLTPLTQYYMATHPRVARDMLADRKRKVPIQWVQGEAPSKRATGRATTKVYDLAEELESHLAALTGKNASLTASVIIQMMKRKSFACVRDVVVDALKDEFASSKEVDTTIVDSTKAFLQRHSSKGTRKKVEQDAVDAVLVASTFGVPEASTAKVATRLEQRYETVSNMAKKARTMKDNDKRYTRRTRKKRFDNVQEPAALAVFRFCHSEESSKLDTESYRVRKVYDVERERKVRHPDRVWNDVGIKDRYATFKKSHEYATFKVEHPERDICVERFRQFCCKCVRDPTAKSCADLIHTALRYYGQGLQAASLTNQTVKNRVETCDCAGHLAYRNVTGSHAAATGLSGTHNSADPSNQMNATVSVEDVPLGDEEDGTEFIDVEVDMSGAGGENATSMGKPPIMVENLFCARTTDMIEATCCPCEIQPMLRPTAEKEEQQSPKLIPWSCTHGDCDKCGVDRLLQPMLCPALSKCDEVIEVMEWRLAPRQGTNKKGETNTQIELTKAKEPVSVVYSRYIELLKKARRHHTETQWLRITRKLDIDTLSSDELLIFTDFSATMDLRAVTATNSSTNAHAVLAIYVVLHSPRQVSVVEGGVTREMQTHDCDVFNFFGDTISKGKKNDNIFHNACLKHIVEHYKKERSENKDDPIKRCRIWTDNCAAQYKCRHNFWRIASFPKEVDDVTIIHRFAQVYDFKGVWDGAGKVVKYYIRGKEVSTKDGCHVRSPGAFGCFETCLDMSQPKNAAIWKKYEQDNDPKILRKGTFATSKRIFGYATEDEAEYASKKSEFEHILYTDRVKTETTKAIRGTIGLHSVIGTGDKRDVGKGEEWLLNVAAMPCACLSCRGLVNKICPYVDIRQEREEWVSLQPPPRQNHSRAVEPEDALLFAKVCRLLNVDKLTKKPMEAFLKERNRPQYGNKRVLADRIVAFFEPTDGQATVGDGEASTSTAGQATDGAGEASLSRRKHKKKNPLATNHITTDSDLFNAEYNSDDDDDEEEEPVKAVSSPEDNETDDSSDESEDDEE